MRQGSPAFGHAPFQRGPERPQQGQIPRPLFHPQHGFEAPQQPLGARLLVQIALRFAEEPLNLIQSGLNPLRAGIGSGRIRGGSRRFPAQLEVQPPAMPPIPSLRHTVELKHAEFGQHRLQHDRD